MKMESGQHISISFHLLDAEFPGGSFAVSLPPGRDTVVQLGSTVGTAPARALAAPLVAGCYLVSRDSRYSSAMS